MYNHRQSYIDLWRGTLFSLAWLVAEGNFAVGWKKGEGSSGLCWGRILRRIRGKSLKSFPPLLVTFTSSYKFYSPLNKSGLKLVCNVNIVYGNLKSENTQDYAWKPQRNCMFTNFRLLYRSCYLGASFFLGGGEALFVGRNSTYILLCEWDTLLPPPPRRTQLAYPYTNVNVPFRRCPPNFQQSRALSV